jgi:hypothetical protein
MDGAELAMLMSDEGVRIIDYDVSDPSAPKPVHAAIARYADSRILGLDYATQTYVEMSLDAGIQRTLAEDKLIYAMQPGSALAEIGIPPTTAIFYLPGALQRLPLTATVGGRPAQAYLASHHGRQWRLWYAIDLPVPPAGIRDRLTQLSVDALPAAPNVHRVFMPLVRRTGTSAITPTPAQEAAGRVLLRMERQDGGQWRTALDTTSIKPASVPSSTFEAPPGWKPLGSLAGGAILSSAALQVAQQADPRPIQGPGPISDHPELHLFYWGSSFSEPNRQQNAVHELTQAVKELYTPPFIEPLAAYGIRPGGVKGVYFDADDPPKAVGDIDVASVQAFVIGKMLTTSAPMVWWTVGDHDPIYTIFVPKDVIDSGNWGGYHFALPTFAHVFLPFPINLFTHDAIPWMINKVPVAGLDSLAGQPAARDQCRGASQPIFCANLPDCDAATRVVAHEFVEAATDPFPFSGWSDPLRQPVWYYGELADICLFTPGPWGAYTRVGAYQVSTYWSNHAGRCVPESRPSVDIFFPQDNSTVRWQAGGAAVLALADVYDPVDGTLPIAWTIDGKRMSGNFAGNLGLGPHTIAASVLSRQSLVATDSVDFTVFADPPQATIVSPATGSFFNAGDPIVLTGSAADPQDGALSGGALRWSVNGVDIGTGAQVTTSVDTVSEAVVTLTARNSAGLSASISITLYIRPAGSPVVTITQPADGSGFQDGGPINFSAQVTVNGQPTSDYTISWKDNLDGTMGTGPNITFTLSGGGCSGIIEHHVNAFIVLDTIPVQIVGHTITVYVGAIC